MKPVCLIMGAGAGIGGTVGKKFASEGYHAVLCRRSDEAGLETLVSNIKACLLYTSPSPRDGLLSRMPSSA